MNDVLNKALQFLGEAWDDARRRAASEHDRDEIAKERYWNMISAVDCLKEVNVEREKIAELISKYYCMSLETTLHFLADYDYQMLKRKNNE